MIPLLNTHLHDTPNDNTKRGGVGAFQHVLSAALTKYVEKTPPQMSRLVEKKRSRLANMTTIRVSTTKNDPSIDSFIHIIAYAQPPQLSSLPYTSMSQRVETTLREEFKRCQLDGTTSVGVRAVFGDVWEQELGARYRGTSPRYGEAGFMMLRGDTLVTFEVGGGAGRGGAFIYMHACMHACMHAFHRILYVHMPRQKRNDDELEHIFNVITVYSGADDGPNKGVVYIAYFDSASQMSAGQAKFETVPFSKIISSATVRAVVEHAEAMGMLMVYLWACAPKAPPPSHRGDYIDLSYLMVDARRMPKEKWTATTEKDMQNIVLDLYERATPAGVKKTTLSALYNLGRFKHSDKMPTKIALRSLLKLPIFPGDIVWSTFGGVTPKAPDWGPRPQAPCTD